GCPACQRAAPFADTMTARVATPPSARPTVRLSVIASGPAAAWPPRAGTYVSARAAAWRCRSAAGRGCSAVRRREPRPPPRPAAQAGGARGVLGGEIRGRREDRALDVLGLEAVRLLEPAQQLGRRVQNGRAGVCRGRGRAAQSTQGFAHGTR